MDWMDIHGATLPRCIGASRRERPWRAASFGKRGRVGNGEAGGAMAVGGENAVGPSGCGSGGEFFETHLEDGIVVAEEDERDLRGLANAANEIEDACKGGAEFQSALGGALNRRAIGEGITKGHAEFDD